MSDYRDLGWRKSSYSGSSGNCVEVAASWRKSSHSAETGNCVEIGAAGGRRAADGPAVKVRDTKQDGHGPVLEFSESAWRGFLAEIKTGALAR